MFDINSKVHLQSNFPKILCHFLAGDMGVGKVTKFHFWMAPARTHLWHLKNNPIFENEGNDIEINFHTILILMMKPVDRYECYGYFMQGLGIFGKFYSGKGTVITFGGGQSFFFGIFFKKCWNVWVGDVSGNRVYNNGHVIAENNWNARPVGGGGQGISAPWLFAKYKTKLWIFHSLKCIEKTPLRGGGNVMSGMASAHFVNDTASSR